MSFDPQRAKSLFLAALERQADARPALLSLACGDDAELRRRVERLLSAHDRADSQPETGGPAATGAGGPPPMALGPYRLVQEIGEGGMGSVWLAQQEAPVRRLVAVKVIKPGMDSRQVVARFEQERQALALMDHPNVAKVLDAGTTPEGRPYFVMELVEGVTLTRHCDRHRLGPRQRLSLFVDVCKAVQHAHHKGLIHRDLKPSNILVTACDGRAVVKIIDFGVAKAVGEPLTDRTLQTGLGAVVGTPEYMSPEQAQLNQLDIDTRSDIYSLGALLYELLTGTTPLDLKRNRGALLDALRSVREEEPPTPSARLRALADLPAVAANRGLGPARLTRALRGELDWIVMRCLEKDRDRRYQTANALAADIGRYLDDEPVLACPPSAGYRLRKAIRRNRPAILVVALSFALLLGGIVGTTVGLVRAGRAARAEADLRADAERERDAKEAERAKARASLRTAQRAIQGLLVRVGRDLTFMPQAETFRLEVFRDAKEAFSELLRAHPDDWALRREAAVTTGWLGGAYHRLGRGREAEAALREAIDSLEPMLAAGQLERAERVELIRFYSYLGWQLGAAKRLDECRKAHARALAHAHDLARDDAASGQSRNIVASCHIDMGNATRHADPAEGERHFRQALGWLDQKGSNRSHLGRAHLALAELHLTGRRWAEADKALDKAEQAYSALTREEPHKWVNRERLADVHIIRGRLRLATGRPADAAASYRQAVTLLGQAQADYPGAAAIRSALLKARQDVRAASARGPAEGAEFRRLTAEIDRLLLTTRGAGQPKPTRE